LTIYLLRKKFSGLKGVLVSSLCGVIVVVIVMIPMNIWLASAFMHMDAISFIKGFLGVCVAFNFIKAGANVLIYNLIAPTLLKEYEKISRK